MLNWIQQFGTFCFLDNHQYPGKHHSAEVLAGAGAGEIISGNTHDILQRFQQKLDISTGWWFGHLGYDLKNEPEKRAVSKKRSKINFPDLLFFRPAILIRLSPAELEITSDTDPDLIYQQIISFVHHPLQISREPVRFGKSFQKDDYISVIRKLKEHILRGDCYEINFCQEFFADNISIDPLSVYTSLCAVSPNPFSAFYRHGEDFLICASPERYLKKQGNRILSQPIKGTSARFPHDERKDAESRSRLKASEKDRAENVMVVDLVRNDLSRICQKSSVKVEELFGVYTFPQVYQMISTVSGELKEGTSFEEIIRATFPMGSMTGAPKKRVLELIEQYEPFKRGLFSGAVGYITPEGDFDFNVVIRSILYNKQEKYLSFPAGSGITFYSDPEKEYEECLLKAGAIRGILS